MAALKQLLLLFPLAVATLFGLNYMITPVLVGETTLESFFRPKGVLQFQSEKWKQISPGGGERYKMVDDLLRRQLLIGRSQEEVKAVLGEPSIAAPEEGEAAMYYLLGSHKDYPARSILFPGGLSNLENWTLAIRFRDGRAYQASIKVD